VPPRHDLDVDARRIERAETASPSFAPCLPPGPTATGAPSASNGSIRA